MCAWTLERYETPRGMQWRASGTLDCFLMSLRLLYENPADALLVHASASGLETSGTASNFDGLPTMLGGAIDAQKRDLRG